MNMLPIERIFVPLQHGSKDRRDIGLPAVAGRQRLAGRVFREERSQRTLTPHHVKRKRLGSVQLAFDNITEVFLDAPCTGHLVVCIDDCVKLYLLFVCESGGILQEEVSRPLEVFVGLHFPSAHGINGSIEVLDQMELVVADDGQRHQILDCIPERIPHVDTCGKHVCSLDRIQGLANQSLRILLLPASDYFKHRSVIIIEDTGEVTSVHGLLIYMYMVMRLYLAAMQKAKLHGTFHDVVDLVERQQEKPRGSRLALRLQKRVYRFFRAWMSSAPLHPPKEHPDSGSFHPRDTSGCEP